MNIEMLVVTIIFIIPGFIITGIKHNFNVRDKGNGLDRTIESILSSLLLYTIIAIIGNIRNNISPFFKITFSGQKINLLSIKLLLYIWIIILISVLLGWFFGKISKSESWGNYYSNIFKRSHYRSVWNEVNETVLKCGDGGVEFKFKGNNQRYVGYIEIASDYDSAREIYLTDVSLIDEDNNNNLVPLNAEGLLAKYDSLDYIICSPGKGKGNTK